jgi:radical SAM/Cys-rich protein
MKSFKEKILEIQSSPLTSGCIDILQVNLGYRCNMSCRHCHIEAGTDRAEIMDKDTVRAVIDALKKSRLKTLDITGGSPEMNPHFLELVEEASKAGIHVIVRTNLTILCERGMERLPECMSSCCVEVIASLPHYTENVVDRMRGSGTFKKCVAAVRKLNALGYGRSPDKRLNFVYNPAGAFLCSASQKSLEEDYRRELGGKYGIVFDNLYTLANVPAGRFKDFLVRTKGLEKYMKNLACSFNPQTIPGLMCRRLVSVSWNGSLHDCDFNQVLGIGVHQDCPQDIRDFDLSRLTGRIITVGDHCYACTAGQGST